MKKAIRGILATALAAGTILSSTVVSFASLVFPSNILLHVLILLGLCYDIFPQTLNFLLL